MLDTPPSSSTYIEGEDGKIFEDKHEHTLSKAILNGHELISLPAEDNNYIIDKLLWENQIIVLMAEQKAGKSLLSLQMACALSCGEAFLDEFEVNKETRILYIQAEGDRYETINRLKNMTGKGGINWNPDNFYHMFPAALSLDTEDGYVSLREKIDELGYIPQVIFVDPLYMSMAGDLSDNQKSRMFCRYMRKLQERYGCAIIIVHHERKPSRDKNGRPMDGGDDGLFGSFVWRAFPSHVLRMRVKKDASRVLTCKTQRNGAVVSEINMALRSPKPLKFDVVGGKEARKDQVLKLMKIENKPVNHDNIVDMTGFCDDVVRKSIGRLLRTKDIEKINPGKRPLWYKVRD